MLGDNRHLFRTVVRVLEKEVSFLLAAQGVLLYRLTIRACICRYFAQSLDEVVHRNLEISPVVYIPDGWILRLGSGGLRKDEQDSL